MQSIKSIISVKYNVIFFIKLCLRIYDKKLPFKSWNITTQGKDNGISLQLLLKYYSNTIIVKNNNSPYEKRQLKELIKTLQVHQQSEIKESLFSQFLHHFDIFDAGKTSRLLKLLLQNSASVILSQNWITELNQEYKRT